MSETEVDKMVEDFLNLAGGDSYLVELAIDKAIAKSLTKRVDPDVVKKIIQEMFAQNKCAA